MPPLSLICHPATPCRALDRLAVDFMRVGRHVVDVTFRPSGREGDLRLPRATLTSARTDGLWRHTCFELFVRAGDGPSYVEINLAPATTWAAYGFDGYRLNMRDLPIAVPRLTPDRTMRPCVLNAVIDLSAVALPIDVAWFIGLSAVIEERDGALSYWALRHPPGKPDFHHRDCFALELPAAD